MKKISFKTGMLLCTLCSGALTVLAFVLSWQAVAITFFTTFYHFAMRLIVGGLVPNRFDHRSRWFQPKAFEEKLYKALKVKKWKAYMPTYDPRLFSLTENTPQQLMANMCQAEVVHEVIILCSFLPLLFTLFLGFFPCISHYFGPGSRCGYLVCDAPALQPSPGPSPAAKERNVPCLTR